MNHVAGIGAVVALQLATELFGDDEDDECLEGDYSTNEARRAASTLKRRARKWVVDPTPAGERRPAGTGKKQRRGTEYHAPHADYPDYKELTGLSATLFEQIYNLMLPQLMEPRATHEGAKVRYIRRTWTPMTRLLMVLTFIRHNSTVRTLANQFGGSPSSISREIWDTIPKLYVTLLDVIKFPEEPPEPIFGDANAAIDCTSHYRHRVHPWSCEYYRGDKHDDFITAQLVCGLDGKMMDVQLGLGHNNDKGMYNATNTEQRLADRSIIALADKGYSKSAQQLIVPINVPHVGNLRHMHSKFRSVVEHNFALVHMFKAAGGVFRQSPELQQMVIMIVYALVYLKCEAQPLRTNFN